MHTDFVRLNYNYLYDVPHLLKGKKTTFKKVKVIEIFEDGTCMIECLHTGQTLRRHVSWLQPDSMFLWQEYYKILSKWVTTGEKPTELKMLSPLLPLFKRKHISPIVLAYHVDKTHLYFIDSFGQLERCSIHLLDDFEKNKLNGIFTRDIHPHDLS